LILLVRWSIYHWVEKVIFPAQIKGRITPADASLDFEDFVIPTAGNRQLQAWHVYAADHPDPQKVVLIYPGSDQTMSDWVPAMSYFCQRGISSVVFDYSGRGSNSDRAHLTSICKDAQSAYLAFLNRVPSQTRKYLVGSSLGAGPLLAAATSVECEVDGVFIISPFVSIREAISRLTSFPKALSFMIPEVFNILRLIQNLCVPMVLIHSLDDEIFPSEMSERIYAAAREPKYLVLLHGLGHHDMLQGKEAQYLAPVADLINK
jgi:alpha-beta hydrolase superfamily lysophospholipase